MKSKERPVIPKGDKSNKLFPIVGIGASAGGFESLERFLSVLPKRFGFAMVFIQHLSPIHKNLLPELLRSRRSGLKVEEVSDGLKILPGRLYLCPPAQEVRIEQGILRIASRAHRHLHLPIDEFFITLAADTGERAIAVVLSGAGTDGARGVKAIRASGGTVFVQDPATAEFSSMPVAAINTGQTDGVLSPEAIAKEILKLRGLGAVVTPSEDLITQSQLEPFYQLIYEKTAYRFHHYKKSVVSRRIRRRMYLHGISSVKEYLEMISKKDVEAAQLASDLMIGVTSFFRDRLAWKALHLEVTRKLVAQEDTSPIRIWTAACATGEEAYSIAMMLRHEFDAAGKRRDIQVFATDVNDRALERAREGIYPESISADLPPEYMEKFFTYSGNGMFVTVNKEMRQHVVFAKHDLIADPPFSRLDLVICRNLLIYLEPEAQEQCISIFHYALKEGGYLFLGNAESPGRNKGLFASLAHKKCRVYRKIEGKPSARMPLSIPSLTERPIGLSEKQAQTAEYRESQTHFIQVALLEEYAPAAVAVDQRHNIVYHNGPTNRYLRQPRGTPSQHLMDLLPATLRNRIRSGLYRAAKEEKPISIRAMIPGDDERKRQVIIRISRLREHLFLIVFREKRGLPSEEALSLETTVIEETAIRQLEDELSATRNDLQNHIEQLKSLNEELQASNEELQAANEELETSREELQSLNEELTTVNSQLQTKIEEQEETNNDLNNFLASTNIPTIFLDTRFRVKRFTPAMSRLIKLIPSDVGRPIIDMSQESLGPDLIADSRSVLDRLTSVKKEIMVNGSWYVRTALPYRTADNRIEGVVITYTDITEIKEAESALREAKGSLEIRVKERTAELNQANRALKSEIVERKRAEQSAKTERQRLHDVLETLPSYVALLTPDYHVSFANSVFKERFGEPHGRHCYEFLFGRTEPCEICETYTVLKTMEPHRWEWAGPDGRIYDIYDYPFTDTDGTTLIMEMGTDITERKQAEIALREMNETLEQRVAERTEQVRHLATFPQLNPNPVMEVSLSGEITFCNPATEKVLKDLGMKKSDCNAFLPEDMDAILGNWDQEKVSSLYREVAVKDRLFGETVFLTPQFHVARIYAYDITRRKRAEESLRQSEQHVRLKLESILSPEGDISTLGLADIIDVPTVQSLMDDFYALARIPLAIIDLKGNVLVGHGWQEICTKFHRAHPDACKHCIESDTELTKGIPPGESRLYKCKHSMWDIATPITVGGQHMGNVFSGQFFFEDEPIDYELFRTQARQYGFNEEEYMRALEAVPKVSRETVDRAISFLTKLAHTLSKLGYSNIKLARSLAQQEALMDSLRESEQRYRDLVQNANSAIIRWRRDGTITFFNEYAQTFFGYSAQEAVGRNVTMLLPEQESDGIDSITLIKHIVDNPEQYVDNTNENVCRDGRRVWMAWTNRPIFDEKGEVKEILAVGIDITERKKAEDALLQAKQEWERTFASVPDMIAILDNDHHVVRVNEAMAKRLGRKPEEFIGLPCYEAVHKLSGPPPFCPHVKTLKDGKEHTEEVHEDRLGGSFLVSTTPLYDNDGNMVGSVHVAHDITERKRAEDALRESEGRFRNMFERHKAVMLLIDAETGAIIDANTAAVEYYGYPWKQLTGMHIQEINQLPLEDVAAERRKAAAEQKNHFVFQHRLADGSVRWVDVYATPFESHGKILLFSVIHDITDRKQAEEALKRSVDRLDIISNTASQLLMSEEPKQIIEALCRRVMEHLDCHVFFNFLVNEERNCLRLNAYAGIPAETAKEIRFLDFGITVCGCAARDACRIVAENIPTTPDIRTDFVRPFGIKAYACHPLFAQGRVIGTLSFGTKSRLTFSDDELSLMKTVADQVAIAIERVHLRQSAEERADELELRVQERTVELLQQGEILRTALAYNRSLLEASIDPLVTIDRTGKINDVNKATELITGYPREKLIGTNFTDYFADPEKARTGYELAFKEGLVHDFELEIRHRDGHTTPVLYNASVYKDGSGEVAGVFAAARDLTEQRRLEDQLRQTHKMEAIGTLAGGIAHDFNNILGSILGFTEMAIEDVPDHPHVQKSLDRVLKSATRARDLVKQILAFSRKTDNSRSPLSLSVVVKETVQFLRASIPSTIGIRFNMTATSDTVLASPVEIEQVLMNLSSNAAFAMQEKGGTLDISLDDIDFQPDSSTLNIDAEPGQYIQLTVRDTGIGMTPDVLKRVFEPFFTTKSPGQGTGMGLAVVYGIVKSLNGAVTVESEPGEGTVFRVLLPKTKTDEKSESAGVTKTPKGKERILFIDDEELLTEWGEAALKRLGYEVTALTDSIEALRLFSADPSRFDLVVSDQTMPNMTGIQLARELLAIRNDIPIILCTGHSETVSSEGATVEGICEYLIKPLTRHEFAEAIRRVLDAKTGPDT